MANGAKPAYVRIQDNIKTSMADGSTSPWKDVTRPLPPGAKVIESGDHYHAFVTDIVTENGVVKTGYIHITTFLPSEGRSDKTPEEWFDSTVESYKKMLIDLKASGATHLVLDVSDNGGGSGELMATLLQTHSKQTLKLLKVQYAITQQYLNRLKNEADHGSKWAKAKYASARTKLKNGIRLDDPRQMLIRLTLC